MRRSRQMKDNVPPFGHSCDIWRTVSCEGSWELPWRDTAGTNAMGQTILYYERGSHLLHNCSIPPKATMLMSLKKTNCSCTKTGKAQCVLRLKYSYIFPSGDNAIQAQEEGTIINGTGVHQCKWTLFERLKHTTSARFIFTGYYIWVEMFKDGNWNLMNIMCRAMLLILVIEHSMLAQ